MLYVQGNEQSYTEDFELDSDDTIHKLTTVKDHLTEDSKYIHTRCDSRKSISDNELELRQTQ